MLFSRVSHSTLVLQSLSPVLFHAHMSLMTTGQPPEVLDKADAGLLLSRATH